MKKIITMLFLSLLVSSVFAFDLVKVYTCESEVGTCNVYFDFDATKPFDIKNESIEYFLILQDFNEEVEVYFYKNKDEDEDWKVLWDLAVENNCYNIFIENENCNIEHRINIDGSVTVYAYRGTED